MTVSFLDTLIPNTVVLGCIRFHLGLYKLSSYNPNQVITFPLCLSAYPFQEEKLLESSLGDFV